MVNDTTWPTAVISLLLHERGMQVFVAAGPGEDDAVMEVSCEPPGPFKYAARVRPSPRGPLVEAVTVSVKPDARQNGNVLLDRKVLAAVPLAELLRGAQHALGWDLESWGNTIKRWPPPPKDSRIQMSTTGRWPRRTVRRSRPDSRRDRSFVGLGDSPRPLSAAGSAPPDRRTCWSRRRGTWADGHVALNDGVLQGASPMLRSRLARHRG
jgi:hypothetical protein